MTAWDDIINADWSDEWLDKCGAAIAEIQSNYAGRLSRRILAENPDRSSEFTDGVEWAADLINPDTP